MMDVKEMAFLVGLLLGCMVLVSVCWVWIRKQVLGVGGGVLSFFGVLLVGLSVWSGASVEVSADGFRAEFERLEEQVTQVAQKSEKLSDEVKVVAETNKAISKEVRLAAENINVNRSQFLQLTNTLNEKRVLNPVQVRSLSEPITRLPNLDTRNLDVLINRMEQ